MLSDRVRVLRHQRCRASKYFVREKGFICASQMLKRLGKTLNHWNRSLMTAWQIKAFLRVWERVRIAVVFHWLQNAYADVRGKSSAQCQCSTTLFIQSQGQCRWPRGERRGWAAQGMEEWRRGGRVERCWRKGRKQGGVFCPSAHTEVTIPRLTPPPRHPTVTYNPGITEKMQKKTGGGEEI